MKRLNQTESPIFVILCVLCFQRQSFLTFSVIVTSLVFFECFGKAVFRDCDIFCRVLHGGYPVAVLICMPVVEMVQLRFFIVCS